MSENNVKDVFLAIQKLNDAKEELRSLDVFRSERLTGEFGEWFAERLINAKRAASTSQTGWDLLGANGEKIQVKTHAKGDKNKARWTEWNYSAGAFDILMILVFTKEYKLKEAYRIPYQNAEEEIDFEKKQVVLKWDDYSEFNIMDEIRNSELSIFCI